MGHNTRLRKTRHDRAPLLALLVGMMLSPLASAAGEDAATNPAPLQSFDVVYTLRAAGMAVGEVKRSLKLRPDGQHIFEAHSQSTGPARLFLRDVVDERSVWQFVAEGGIRPMSYTYSRTGGRRERHAELSFDWEKNVVSNSIDGETWRMPIPPNAQDKLLYQLALMLDLERGKKELEYAIADGGKLKHYRFDIVGEDVVDTRIGKVRSLILERRREDRVTRIWCAPAWHYLPVRIEQDEKDGDSLQLYVESVSGITPR